MRNKKPTCKTPYCRNPGPGYCSTCRVKKWRKENPVKYAYNNLKKSAQNRNLLFTITFEDFKEWCVKVDYIGRKGRGAQAYTVDRIHNDIGYHLDNIQVMKKRDNVTKFFSYDYRTKRAYTYELPEIECNTPNPF
jgi:hypothetical protein